MTLDLRRDGLRLALSALPAALLALHILQVLPLALVERVEAYLYDLRVQLSAPGGRDDRIVIVDIDERSIGIEGRWPWRRDRIALLLDRLFDAYGVRAVGFDIVFPEADDQRSLELVAVLAAGPAGATPAGRAQLDAARAALATDQRFAEALIARDVVLGQVFKQRVAAGEPATVGALTPPVDLAGPDLSRVAWTRPAGYTGNLPALVTNAAAGGFFDTPLIDEDGKVRRAPLFQRYDGRLYESLALALARLASGSPPLNLVFASAAGRLARLEYVELGERRIPVDGDGALLVPFRGDVGSFPYVAATDVLQQKVSDTILRDRIVLVGTSAPGLVDIRATPVSKLYVGVEAHANMVAGILDGSIRFRPAWTERVELAVLAVISVLTALWLPRLGPLTAAAAVLGIGGLVIGGNAFAWQRLGLALPLAPALALVAAAALLQLTYGYFIETRRKRRLSRLFGQYVPPEVVADLDRSDAEISLDGESREMTVLFSDVRGFTTLSEGLAPRELTQLMNAFLTPITEVIQQHRGTIDKYMGDAVMAFWGAPLADPAHARRALDAALGMVERLAALKGEFAARGWPAINIGIGLSSGPMNVGNMGSRFRMAYTVLGDTVNLGSRIEGLTKEYGVQIAVSEATARAVPDYVFRPLDAVRVKGKLEPVVILEPLGPRDRVPEPDARAAAAFGQALALYRQRAFDQAEALIVELDRVRHRKLYTLYLDRIRHFREQPPPADWDGVFTFTTK
jgi:adenylate cyclase